MVCALASTYVFWTARIFWTARMEIVGQSAGESAFCGRQVFHNCAGLKLRLVDSSCRSDTAVFTGSVAVTRPFVSDVTLVFTWLISHMPTCPFAHR